MKILVTGGAGFIGSHVCERLLSDGNQVWALDNLNNNYSPIHKRNNLNQLYALARPFQFLESDIQNLSSLRSLLSAVRFDQIIHLAGLSGVRCSLQEPATYLRINVEGTGNVLEAARLAGIKKVIIGSSSSVYGLHSPAPFQESAPLHSPASPYAASKIACESLGHVYHATYGLDVDVVRFFSVYGPRQRPDLAIRKFASLMLEGKPVPVFGDGSSARDYTHVDDVVNGLLACIHRRLGSGFEVFNLGTGRAISLIDLVEMISQALNVTFKVQKLPPQLGDVPLTIADISKAGRMMGYVPEVTIQAGLESFASWVRQYKNTKHDEVAQTAQ